MRPLSVLGGVFVHSTQIPVVVTAPQVLRSHYLPVKNNWMMIFGLHVFSVAGIGFHPEAASKILNMWE